MESSACNILPPADLLHYLATYRVIVCSLCQYAVQPTAVSGHLKDIHNLYRVQRQPYMQYASQLQLNTPQQVIASTVVSFPVPSLAVQDGLQCLSKGCGHICISGNRMKSHWIAKHGRRSDGTVDWREVPTQTFFRGNLLRYFTMPLPKEPVVFTSVLPALTESAVSPCVGIQPPDLEAPPPNESLHTLYITTTCVTFSTPSTIHFWRDIVPSLASTQPFLYYGLLALTSLHLSHTTSNSSHALNASHYQSIAMPLFRHAVAHVTKQNCDAILIFMHLLVLYSFGSENDKAMLFLASDADNAEGEGVNEKRGDETEESKGASSLPNWLYFLRNGCILLFSVWDAVEFGLVAEIAASWDIPIPLSASESLHTLSLITYFDTLVPSSTTTTTDSAHSNSDNALWDEDIIAIYKEAASSLASAFTVALVSASPSSPTQSDPQIFTIWFALRIWPMKLTPSFLSLLSTPLDPHPAALILLAHYCLVLRRLDGCWYFYGGARELLGSILKRLGERWRRCVEWPFREIFGYSEEGSRSGVECVTVDKVERPIIR
jgi:hypothetical protein